MYDGYIYCSEYKDLKDIVVELPNSDYSDDYIRDLAKHIYDLYEDGKMSTSQYDDLMSYIEDFL